MTATQFDLLRQSILSLGETLHAEIKEVEGRITENANNAHATIGKNISSLKDDSGSMKQEMKSMKHEMNQLYSMNKNHYEMISSNQEDIIVLLKLENNGSAKKS